MTLYLKKYMLGSSIYFFTYILFVICNNFIILLIVIIHSLQFQKHSLINNSQSTIFNFQRLSTVTYQSTTKI